MMKATHPLQEWGEIQRLTNDRLEGRVDAILKIFQDRIPLTSKSGTVTHQVRWLFANLLKMGKMGNEHKGLLL
jgi:hypothetical protein